MPRGQVLTILLVAALLVGGCESGVPRAEPPTMSPTEPSPLAGVDLSNVPAACIDLGMDDCRRLVAEIAEQVPAGIAPTYIQVGPFGCIEGGGCPRSLIARPQGDVTIEAAGGAISYHVTAAAGGGPLTIERQETFLMAATRHARRPHVRARSLRPLERHRCRRELVGSDRPGRWRPPGRHQRGERHPRHRRSRSRHVHLRGRIHRPTRAARWVERVPGLHVTARAVD